MTRTFFSILFGLGVACAQDGAALYKTHCAQCHDAPAGRVPPFTALRAMGMMKVLSSIESGVMKAQAEGLSSADRHALAGYITYPAPKVTPAPASAFCDASAPPRIRTATVMESVSQWTRWGVDLENTRFQSAAAAGITAADLPNLKLKWAFGLGETSAARAQPSVAGGRVFFGSEAGTVYSLDARTGCIYWTFQAEGSVTAAPSIEKSSLYFGDQRANAYALDAPTGKLLWKVHLDDHFGARVTAASLLYKNVLYVPIASFEEVLPLSPTYECCTFRGSVVALNAATGKRIWKTYTIAQAPQPTKISKTKAQLRGPSGASIWSAPTLDEKRDVIYVATGNNYSDPPTETSDAVLALSRKTGEILWSKQLTPKDADNSGCSSPFKTNCPDSNGPDFDFGQSPILVSLGAGHRALVIGQKSGMAHGLDPDRKGEILWQTRVGQGGSLGGSQWGSAADHDNMYVAVSDLKITGIVLDKTAAEGYRLTIEPQQGGGLFALKLSTGEKVWSAKPAPCGERKPCSPAQSAPVSVIPGVVFSGSVDGHLRAYSTATGEVIWDMDTAREYDTVNGQKARGGSLDAAGAVIAGGMLYVNSGYGQWGGLPGNVLLAFSVDGK
ncbi:MAG: PQQ-binding-like beta-propeller repeat protein [Bryobacteraceae bacterium]|jgi:polyvinyl alcohol dehydrogenase (cytochrome)